MTGLLRRAWREEGERRRGEEGRGEGRRAEHTNTAGLTG